MRCTCPEDWQGMDHTAGCKARATASLQPPEWTAEELAYLREIEARSSTYDHTMMLGGVHNKTRI